MQRLLLIPLLALILVACTDKKSGSGGSKTTQQPITASSSQLAQDIAGKKWCSTSSFFDEELNIEMYERYELNMDGSAVFTINRSDNDKAISSDKASWSASETSITFSFKGEKITGDAYFAGNSLTITRELDGNQSDDIFTECGIKEDVNTSIDVSTDFEDIQKCVDLCYSKDCVAEITNDKDYCTSKDCVAKITNDSDYCYSKDCVAEITNDRDYCTSKDCVAKITNDSEYCYSKDCAAIVKSRNNMCSL